MRLSLLIILLLVSITGKSQSSYSGHLGTFPITLILHHQSDSDGILKAYYVYDTYDNTITINGNLKNKELTLFEKDNAENISATLAFENFNKNDKEIRGKWISADSTKAYPILLQKDFDISDGDDMLWEDKELIQSKTTKEHYFKTVITKEQDDYYAKISRVKIFEKGTDRLIQTIKLDCQLWGISNLNIGDFNFDGIQDFSVFEASYAGSNTSSIYILRDAHSEKYLKSNIRGSSLEFDNDLKVIYEYNQCCAGRSRTEKAYKVVDNEMILIERKCLEYNDDKEDYIEIKCE